MEDITKLAESLKSEDVRKTLTAFHLLQLKSNLESSIKDAEHLELHDFTMAFQIFRCLRNSCIQSKKNQLLVLENGFLDVFVDALEVFLSPKLCIDDQKKEILEKMKATSIQFLGNLVVQNKQTQDAVWKYGFPTLFFNLMSSIGFKEKNFLCMVIYNCLKGRSRLYCTENEYWLFVSIVEYCKDYHDAEWGLFIMELIITSTSFVSFYKELNGYLELRMSLVDYICACLANENESVKIPEENIQYLCEELVTKSKCILMLASGLSADVEELQQQSHLVFKILSMLCDVTGDIEKYKKVRSDEKLLDTLIELLRQKQSVKREDDSASMSNASPNEPFVGLERNLVRVIGNMSYRNKKIQDKIRERNAIEVLLNACNIDHQNPYIMQWAIFAIRNICEDNAHNKLYISNLEKQGLAPNKILSASRLETRLENGKIKISSSGDGGVESI